MRCCPVCCTTNSRHEPSRAWVRKTGWLRRVVTDGSLTEDGRVAAATLTGALAEMVLRASATRTGKPNQRDLCMGTSNSWYTPLRGVHGYHGFDGIARMHALIRNKSVLLDGFRVIRVLP